MPAQFPGLRERALQRPFQRHRLLPNLIQHFRHIRSQGISYAEAERA
jgi:hypothetical protein